MKHQIEDKTRSQIIQKHHIGIEMMSTNNQNEDSSSEDNTDSSEDSQSTGDMDFCGDDEVQRTIDKEKDQKINHLKKRVHELEQKTFG